MTVQAYFWSLRFETNKREIATGTLWNKKQFGSVPLAAQCSSQPPRSPSVWCLAQLTKLTRQSWQRTAVSWQTWHRQRCLLTWTVTKYGAMQPLAKKLHQSSQECSLRQKCALICLSNCYAWICPISNNQASANLECCWTIKFLLIANRKFSPHC